MALVYYPKQTLILKRDTVSASFEQIVLSTSPNTILYFGSNSLSEISASSFEITTSWANNVVSSSYAISASWAPPISSDNSIYSISSSFASSSISSSYARTASYANFAIIADDAYNAQTLNGLDENAFFDISNMNAGTLDPSRVSSTGIYPMTSSWSISSSYAISSVHSISSSFASSSISSSYVLPSETTEYIYIPAYSLVPNSTNGPQPWHFEISESKVNLQTFAFDYITAEIASYHIRFPNNWNHTRPLKFSFDLFDNQLGDSGSVVMGIKAMAISNYSLTGSWGTEVSASATFVSQNSSSVKSNTATGLTPLNVSGVDNLICFNVTRKVDDVNDTHLADAYLLGIKVEYTTNTSSWSGI
jgi:hypothetical protein